MAFQQSRKDEFEGFIKDGTFVTIQESNIKPNIRIFGSTFIDELKTLGDKLTKNSGFIAKLFADGGACTTGAMAYQKNLRDSKGSHSELPFRS